MSLDKVKCEAFFQSIKRPTLSPEESDDLGGPITLTELTKKEEAVAGMKRGKSPKWDGIPSELYSTLWDLL